MKVLFVLGAVGLLGAHALKVETLVEDPGRWAAAQEEREEVISRHSSEYTHVETNVEKKVLEHVRAAEKKLNQVSFTQQESDNTTVLGYSASDNKPKVCYSAAYKAAGNAVVQENCPDMSTIDTMSYEDHDDFPGPFPLGTFPKWHTAGKTCEARCKPGGGRTVRRTTSDQACAFPFEYKGVTYTGATACAEPDRYPNDAGWCYISDFDGSGKQKWRDCKSGEATLNGATEDWTDGRVPKKYGDDVDCWDCIKVAAYADSSHVCKPWCTKYRGYDLSDQCLECHMGVDHYTGVPTGEGSPHENMHSFDWATISDKFACTKTTDCWNIAGTTFNAGWNSGNGAGSTQGKGTSYRKLQCAEIPQGHIDILKAHNTKTSSVDNNYYRGGYDYIPFSAEDAKTKNPGLDDSLYIGGVGKRYAWGKCLSGGSRSPGGPFGDKLTWSTGYESAADDGKQATCSTPGKCYCIMDNYCFVDRSQSTGSRGWGQDEDGIEQHGWCASTWDCPSGMACRNNKLNDYGVDGKMCFLDRETKEPSTYVCEFQNTFDAHMTTASTWHDADWTAASEYCTCIAKDDCDGSHVTYKENYFESDCSDDSMMVADGRIEKCIELKQDLEAFHAAAANFASKLPKPIRKPVENAIVGAGDFILPRVQKTFGDSALRVSVDASVTILDGAASLLGLFSFKQE